MTHLAFNRHLINGGLTLEMFQEKFIEHNHSIDGLNSIVEQSSTLLEVIQRSFWWIDFEKDADCYNSAINALPVQYRSL